MIAEEQTTSDIGSKSSIPPKRSNDRPTACPLRAIHEPDECSTTEPLIETLHKISATKYYHSGQGLQSVHAKSHALITGVPEFLSDLLAHVAQGLFSTGRSSRHARQWAGIHSAQCEKVRR